MSWSVKPKSFTAYVKDFGERPITHLALVHAVLCARTFMLRPLTDDEMRTCIMLTETIRSDKNGRLNQDQVKYQNEVADKIVEYLIGIGVIS